ncbi:uncharacterized protein LOC143275866 isoform X2 [Babylonia areolata]
MAASKDTQADMSSGHADVTLSAESRLPDISEDPVAVDRVVHDLQHVQERTQQALEEHSHADCEEMELDSLGVNTDLTADHEAPLFVRTPAMMEAYSTLQETGMVILCGPPGCGKRERNTKSCHCAHGGLEIAGVSAL